MTKKMVKNYLTKIKNVFLIKFAPRFYMIIMKILFQIFCFGSWFQQKLFPSRIYKLILTRKMTKARHILDFGIPIIIKLFWASTEAHRLESSCSNKSPFVFRNFSRFCRIQTNKINCFALLFFFQSL